MKIFNFLIFFHFAIAEPINKSNITQIRSRRDEATDNVRVTGKLGAAATGNIITAIVGVTSLFTGAKYHQDNAALARRLADETAKQLDQHHEEEMKLLRIEGEKNRDVLIQGFSISVEYIADHERLNTIDQLNRYINVDFFAEKTNTTQIIKILSTRFNHKYDKKKLSSENMNDVTSWWLNRNPLNCEQRQYQIAITQQLLAYWIVAKYFNNINFDSKHTRMHYQSALMEKLWELDSSAGLGQWETWSDCSKKCGIGERMRERKCISCEESSCDLIETETCKSFYTYGDLLSDFDLRHRLEIDLYPSSAENIWTFHEDSWLEHGCDDGECWAYCGLNWQSGQWCYTYENGIYTKPSTCVTAADCACAYDTCSSYCTFTQNPFW